MFCRRCGNKLNDGDLFCSKCGSKVETEIEEVVFPEPVVDVVEESETQAIEETVVNVEVEATPVAEETKEPRGPWKVFAIIGYVYGIVALACMLFPFFSFAMSVEGIVFSALGKKSIAKREKADKGLSMNITACIINYIWSIALYVIIIVISMNY